MAGINMAGGNDRYEGTIMSNRLKVVGIDLVSSGDIDTDQKLEQVMVEEEGNFIYRRLILKDGAIVGCILFGDISGSQEILKAVETKRDVSGLKHEILAKGFNFRKLTD